jgi:hypothetical protein
MDLLKQIRRLNLFEGVPAEKLQALAEQARYRTYQVG